MILTNLKDRLVEWLKGGPEGDVAVSSRVRLARNVAGHPFVGWASDKQKAAVEVLLRNVLLSADVTPPLTYVELHGLDDILKDLLLERRLISHQHAEADWVRGVAFDHDEQLSVMVNEEDHVRIQSIRGGLQLEEAYRGADRFDDLLAERVPFAYSAQYGYLTACPTNVGTGLRASVMLHLPGLTMTHRMDQVIKVAERKRLSLRGIYGEGTHGAGDFYQISNRASLGVCEEEVIESVAAGTSRLTEMERRARSDLCSNDPDGFREHLRMAFHMLSCANSISSQETLSLLSQVRMGLAMSVLSGTRFETLNILFLLTLPAHLQTMEGRVVDSSIRNELRADYVKRILASG